MDIMRVVVTGSVGAGKSTFVRTASDVEVVGIERTATDETALFKKTTTVAFDYGRISIDSNLDVHIYGTPGQSRFDFMWDILIRDADAYILLVAANQPAYFSYAHQIASFMSERVNIPMLVGFTHLDCSGAWQPEEIMPKLGYTNPQTLPPRMGVNPTERSSTLNTLKALRGLCIS